MKKSSRIEINPRIKGGKPVVKGTRVPVEVIIGALAGGMKEREVADEYAISKADIKACLEFAAQVLAEEQFIAVSGR